MAAFAKRLPVTGCFSLAGLLERYNQDSTKIAIANSSLQRDGNKEDMFHWIFCQRKTA